jgi:hypothetical protein
MSLACAVIARISRYEPPTEAPTGEPVTIRQATQILGVYTST